jgi:prephenate dehydrogenase
MSKANNIWCFDVNESEKQKVARIKKADYIFLCVPLQQTVLWLLKYQRYLLDKIIVEQCSIKRDIYANPLLKNLNFLPMHILFKPSATPNYNDRNCIMFKDSF